MTIGVLREASVSEYTARFERSAIPKKTLFSGELGSAGVRVHFGVYNAGTGCKFA